MSKATFWYKRRRARLASGEKVMKAGLHDAEKEEGRLFQLSDFCTLAGSLYFWH
jgi:hypothetical protein